MERSEIEELKFMRMWFFQLMGYLAGSEKQSDIETANRMFNSAKDRGLVP